MNQIIQSKINLTVRKANLDDLIRIKILFMNTILEVCKNDYPEDQLEAWASLVEDTESWKKKLATQYFILAEHANKLVGFASLQCNNEIDLLYVHKDYQRQGIASELLTEILKKALTYGAPSLIANVSITAKRFFKLKGFFTIKEQRLRVKDVVITNYRMQKVLK